MNAVRNSVSSRSIASGSPNSGARVVALEPFQVRGQGSHLFFQLLEASEETGLGLAGQLQETAFTAVGDERLTIEAQLLDVKRSRLGPCQERSVLLFDPMRRQFIAERVEDAERGVGLPVIALEFVTGVAAVDPVLRSCEPPRERGWK
jgi:hypothetical protein